MARTTVADLLERIEALEAEVEALKAAPTESPVSFVVTREAHVALPLPSALNFREMADDQGLAYAYPDMYWDPDYWGANRYL